MSRLRVDITGDGTKLGSALNQSKGLVKNWAGDIKSTIAGAFSVGAVTQMFRATSDYIDRIDDSASSMGRTAEEVQGLALAAALAGRELGDVERLLQSISRSQLEALQNPTGKEAQAFGRMGIGTRDLETMNELRLLERVASKLGNSNPSQIRGMAGDLVGGKDIGTLFSMKEFLADFSQFIVEQKDLKRIASDEQVAEHAQALDALKMQWNNLMVALVPALTFLVRLFNSVYVVVRYILSLFSDTMALLYGLGVLNVNEIKNERYKTATETQDARGMASDLFGSSWDDLVKGYKDAWAPLDSKDLANKQILSQMGPGKQPRKEEDKPKDTKPKNSEEKIKPLDFSRSGLASVGNFLGLDMRNLNMASSLLQESRIQSRSLRSIDASMGKLVRYVEVSSGKDVWLKEFLP